MDECYGQHGWREFHRNRKDILQEYDKILEQTKNRPLQVAHGQGVEAYIRKWLGEFLPKKYGVTSGYIIPDIYNDSSTIYHYDIIIYNRLDSPVLWTEGNEDHSTQGKSLAIPAKYVVAIYEVKSRFNKKSITEAFEKLQQTSVFSDQLHPLYVCGTIFIDLKERDNNNSSLVKELIKGRDVFGFYGGAILRYEGDDTCTGLIHIVDVDEKNKEQNDTVLKPIAKPIDSLNIYMTENGNLQIAESGAGAKLVATSENNWSVAKTYGRSFYEGNKSIFLNWSRGHFADFCIDMLRALEGRAYNDKNQTSFGQIFDHVETKKAPLQNSTPEKGKPFVDLRLSKQENGENKLANIDFRKAGPPISFFITIENQGACDVIASDNRFKNSINLKPGQKAERRIDLSCETKDEEKKLRKMLKQEALQYPCRLVYHPADSQEEFYAIEKTISITRKTINIE